MKKRWPALILAMIFTLFAAAGALAAPARAGSQAAIDSAQRVSTDQVSSDQVSSDQVSADQVSSDQEFASFLEDIFAGYTVEISDARKAELHRIFDRITALEADENYLEAYEQWNQFYSLTDPLWENAVYEYPAFDEFAEELLPEDINDADRTELERLYNQAVNLENSGDWETAQEVWTEFDSQLDSCWESSDEISWDEDSWDEDSWDEDSWYEDSWDENAEYPSFEDYYGEEYLDELGLDAAERAQMKALYEEAVTLEESGDWDAAETKWQELWDIEAAHYDYYLDNYEYPSFEEFIADYDGNFSDRAREQMKTVYDEAVRLEKSGDWEAAAGKWDALYYIMDQCGAFEAGDDQAV